MTKQLDAKIKKVIEAANHAKTVQDWGEDAENFHEVMTPDFALELIAALEQSQQYAKQRDEENQDLMLTIGRLRVEREQAQQLEIQASEMSVQLSKRLTAAEKRVAELEANSKAEHELFLRAKALMYCSGGTPIERSLNPIDAWLYDAEHAAGGQVEGSKCR